MKIERNQVWKFQGRLWRVEGVEGTTATLVELLGEKSMEALTLWLMVSSEWSLVYEHNQERRTP